MRGLTTGLGSAGVFVTNNGNNGSPALSVQTNGGASGAAIRAVNSGKGVAGVFAITNANNGSAAPADPLTRAREILRRMVLEHARARDNPRLLLHGSGPRTSPDLTAVPG